MDHFSPEERGREVAVRVDYAREGEKGPTDATLSVTVTQA